MVKAIFSHYFGRGWQSIAKKNGLQLLTDLVHLSPIGASLVSQFLDEFIETSSFNS